MLPVGDLLTSVRYQLGDMQGVSVSDHDVIEYLNRSVALLYSVFAEHRVSVAGKHALLTVLDDGRVEVPEDFYSVRHVREKGACYCVPTPHRPPERGEYRIVGSMFEAPKGEYDFEYYRLPPRVANLNDELDVPAYLRARLLNIAVAFVKKGVGMAESEALRCCFGVAGNDLSRLTNMGPVSVWGGRA